jgi:hypothetical protein
LQVFPWGAKKDFFSFSFSNAAKQLFCFYSNEVNFPVDAFREMFQPILLDNSYRDNLSIFPREGIGCWHPVFPARSDDIWLLASIAVKQMENVLRNPEKFSNPCLILYKQGNESGEFKGIMQSESPK